MSDRLIHHSFYLHNTNILTLLTKITKQQQTTVNTHRHRKLLEKLSKELIIGQRQGLAINPSPGWRSSPHPSPSPLTTHHYAEAQVKNPTQGPWRSPRHYADVHQISQMHGGRPITPVTAVLIAEFVISTIGILSKLQFWFQKP